MHSFHFPAGAMALGIKEIWSSGVTAVVSTNLKMSNTVVGISIKNANQYELVKALCALLKCLVN